MYFRRWILLIALLLVGAFGAAAQEPTPQPVLDVLASAPDTPEAREILSYANYAAMTGGTTDEQSWIDALRTLISGPSLNNFVVQVEDQERLIGLSPFDVGQAATWGLIPPTQVTLLQGATEAAAIEAAHAARDYSQTETAGLALLCGPDGCESGASINPTARDPGNPFGGDLGRQQPVLLVPVADGLQLLSSPTLESLEQAALAAAGEIPSLADSPDYQAAVRAVTDAGTLYQAHFLNAEAFGPAPDDAAALPPYTLAVLAETESAEGLIATVTLVYPTLADAEVAASALESRISSPDDDSFAATLKERGVLFETSAAEDADTGLGLTQMVLRAPESERSPYSLLINGWYRYELGWLAP